MSSIAVRSIAGALTAAMALIVVGFAQAQEPSYAVRQESIRGVVRSFDGAYTMYVRDEHGFLDRVQLHQGTIINPTGIRLEGGMRVTVYGHPAGPVFIADEIDTPYHFRRDYYPYANPYGMPYAYPPWGFGPGWGSPDWDDWEGCC